MEKGTVWEVYKIVNGTKHEVRRLFYDYADANRYCSALLNTHDDGTTMTTWINTNDGESHVIYRPMNHPYALQPYKGSSAVEIHIFPRYVY